MSFHDLVGSRFSQRAYDPGRPVARELIEGILETARLAPSARNLQPWQFVVAESAEARAAIAGAYSRDWLRDAPVIVAVKGKRSQAWKREHDGYDSLETDLTIALDHLILAATERGLGTCWIAHFDPAVLKRALDLGDDETVFAITPLGYAPAGFSPPAQRSRRGLPELASFK